MASIGTDKRTGNIVIRSYAGIRPDTGRPRTISMTLPAGSDELSVITACSELDSRAAVIKGYSATMTVGAALRWWESGLAADGKSPSTISSYSSYLRRHIYPRIGGVYVEDATAAIFGDLFDALREPKDAGGPGLSDATIQKIHSMLRGAYKKLVTRNKVPFNPVADLPVPKGVPPEAAILLPEDYGALVRYLLAVIREPVRTDEEYYQLMFATLIWLDLHSGLRRGELAGAFDAHWVSTGGVPSICVAQTLVYDASSETGLTYKKPKSKSSRRIVTIDADTVRYVNAYRGVRNALLHARGIPVTRTTPLFCHADGTPMKPAEITIGFSDLVDELEIDPSVHLHTLRHTHASYLLNDGATLVDIQKRLGHCTVAITGDLYTHQMPGKDESVARAAADVTSEMAGRYQVPDAAEYAPICPETGCTCVRFRDMEEAIA